MSTFTWVMLAVFAIAVVAVAWPLLLTPLLLFLGHGSPALPEVVVRKPDGSIVTVDVDWDVGKKLELGDVLSGAGLPSSPMPTVIVTSDAIDSPLGRQLLGLPEMTVEEQKASRFSLARVKPWVAAGVSLLLLFMAVWVVLRAGFSADDKKSAWGVIGAVGAFWIGAVTT